jgi:hypothetical protein
MKKLLLAIIILGGYSAACAETFSYEDLIGRLTDLERLATLPVQGDKCAQWSSYDRHSKYDSANDRYIDWEANGDGNGYIRRELSGIVMAEMNGPGCIWRIWSAKAGSGHVQIYLDGANEPAVDLPFSGYFDGKNEPFTRSSLVNTVSQGLNCYVPIPYQKSCKIVAKSGWGQYFHFTYENFPAGIVVPTFKRQLSAKESAALDRADKILANSATYCVKRDGEKTEAGTVTVKPRGKAQLLLVEGQRAITSLRIRPELPQNVEQQRDILRELVMQIKWDGEKEASVWCPLGDFFGTAPGINNYSSIPLGMTSDGFYSNWYMPFAKGAVVGVSNDGNEPRSLQFEIVHAPLSRPVSELGRFHAKWHRDAFLPDKKKWAIDWTMLTTQGRGRFCGVMLQVWNPMGGWWGEGDEKFYVDGEKFPSTFGTGSEDYFGYAWCDPALFQNAYHNQTINSRGWNFDHISVNRWHITDNVPFERSFDAYIEKYYPNERPTLYACVAYWYLSAGGVDPYKEVPLSQRNGYYIRPSFPLTVAGLKVLERPAGSVQPQGMDGWGRGKWTGGDQLWWTDAKPGDKLLIELSVKKEGRYKITGKFTKAPDYATIQCYVDGKKVGESIDLFNSGGVTVSDNVVIGEEELTAGEHKLTVEIVGANPQAIKTYMVGIDWIKLES